MSWEAMADANCIEFRTLRNPDPLTKDAKPAQLILIQPMAEQ